MHWIHDYQLFLFDFDGLLVNTEELHYKAYQRMCLDRGFCFDWEWKQYVGAAMYESSGLKNAIYSCFPALEKEEPNWDVLYAEKKRAYADLLKSGAVELMPGVVELLTALEQAAIPRCVVTHSPLDQVAAIRHIHPLLDTIPHWITRADYTQPKPHPECYLKAISLLGKPGDRIIGFEDSPRGLKALVQTSAEAVLVSSSFEKEEILKLVEKPFRQVFSLKELG